jgi:hypothetical protein
MQARGTWLEGLMGLSYNRWAMELLAVSEFRFYQDNQRNEEILIAKGVGVRCALACILSWRASPHL